MVRGHRPDPILPRPASSPIDAPRSWRPSASVRPHRQVGTDQPGLRITAERLARDAPELNAIGAAWRDLKRHHLARTPAGLDRAIQETIAETTRE